MNSTDDAERTILGSLIVGNIAPSSLGLAPRDFTQPLYAAIFRSMLHIEKVGLPLDLVTLRRQMPAADPVWLASLVDGLPPLSNLSAHGRIVRDASRSRVLAAALKAAAEADGPDAQAAAAAAALDAHSSTRPHDGPTPVSGIVKSAFESFEAIATRQGIIGLPTGFAALDKILGGLKPGDLVVLAARPGVGKSALAMQVAQRSSARTLFVSLEMSKLALVRRILSTDSGVNQRAIPFGLRESQWTALAAAGTRAYSLPIWLDSHASTVQGVKRSARSIPNLGLIVVDYLQLMDGQKGENRQQEIAGISRGLKHLAEEMQLPILALSQLSRGTKDRKDKRPQLEDLRESGAIEQDADIVLMIYREEMHAPTDANAGRADIIVAKQREGDTGTVRLNWDKTTTRFFEDEQPEPSQESLL